MGKGEGQASVWVRRGPAPVHTPRGSLQREIMHSGWTLRTLRAYETSGGPSSRWKFGSRA